ncbi:hypothetical protein K1719_022298 [Acacia pycnantha]|nr:hypothetical protein K1719_022298 [Acacia pycnantha]
MIGKMIKVDRSTSIYDKGGFARICVEIDLKQPLLPTYMLFGEERSIIYEGLHHVCFTCGKYGHQKNECPLTKATEKSQDPEPESAENLMGKEGDKLAAADSGDGDIGKDRSKEKDVGPTAIKTRGRTWRLEEADLQFPTSSIRKGFNEEKSQTVTQQSIKDMQDSRMMSAKKEKVPVSRENKNESVLINGAVKSEWVSVGSKRKNQSKGKVKGKENSPPASRDIRKTRVGRGSLIPSSSNSFTVLQNLEVQNNSLISPTCVGPKADKGMEISLDKVMVEKPGCGVSLSQPETASQFAERTSRVMATSLNTVQTGHSFGDLMLYTKAQEAKQVHFLILSLAIYLHPRCF